MRYPKALEKLIESYAKLPGIGRKSAERLAMFSIEGLDKEDLQEFAQVLATIKDVIKKCSVCGHITDIDPCSICNDDSRDKSTIMVVGESKDVFAMEKMGNYKGYYHVLGGFLSPMNGIGVEDLNIKNLVLRLRDEEIKEVIIATSATIEGEATAMYISKLLANTGILITRIAHGIPVGSDLGYADDLTLLRALEGRKQI